MMQCQLDDSVNVQRCPENGNRPFAGSVRPTLFWSCLALVWFAFLFTFGISVGPLYRTEALRAVLARNTLEGSWLIPTLYGEPFLTKPPGLYLAIALCSRPGGAVTIISARWPSVLAAFGIVGLFYLFFRVVFPRVQAIFAAMLIPASPLWLDRVPSAEIDLLLVFWVVAAFYCASRSLALVPVLDHPGGPEQENTTKQSLIWWMLSLLCVAAGFLTKWTAPAFFYPSLLAWLWWGKQLRVCYGWRHLMAASSAVLLCLIWILAVGSQVGWDRFAHVIYAEAAQRFAPGHSGKAYPWLESVSFPFIVMGANAPWSILALGSLRPSFYRSFNPQGRALLRLFHCWASFGLIFWSLPTQHHIRYCLPLTPVLSALGLMVLIRWWNEKSATRSAWTRRLLILTVLLCWGLTKLVYTEAIVGYRATQFHPEHAAAQLNDLVPEQSLLYVAGWKDEGIIFLVKRKVKRFQWDQIPASGSYLLLIESEWQRRISRKDVLLIGQMSDQQGSPIYLVRVL